MLAIWAGGEGGEILRNTPSPRENFERQEDKTS